MVDESAIGYDGGKGFTSYVHQYAQNVLITS